MRSHKLLDTAIAGAATGGILNTFKRGVPGFLPGVITAGLVCTTAQGLLNELNVARVKYISRSDALRHDGPAAPPERVRSFSEKLMDGLGVVLPVKKITDDEYLQMLLREREEVERRLEVVRKELNDVEEESGS
ncbi:hypothetical protein K439DRAFT_1631598 [Ramaria rubella]|nr:hypothetical protein K439DRAFT_1631598 [Ramaria rubella]